MESIHQNIFSPSEVQRLRKETIGCSFVNHLNNAGAALMPDVVTKSILDHIKLESEIGGYEAAALQSNTINEFYNQTGSLINCKPTNIAFTASATDSYTRALSSIPFIKGDVILTDCDDFISNQIQFLSLQKKFDLCIVRIQNSVLGGVDLTDLEEKLFTLKPKLFAITHIPTNSGLVQPVKKIAEIFGRYQKQHGDRTWYILDACQSAGQMKLDVQELRCDFLSVTIRKFLRGPRGTGFFYISDRALQAGLEPLFIDMRGADWIEKDIYTQQPDARRFEDWEFAYALVIGSSEAIQYCRNIGEENIQQQVILLSKNLRSQLTQLNTLQVLDRGSELSSSVTFTINKLTPKYILNQLAQRKINVVASYRNYAVIDFDEKKVEWAIRVSPHYYNTENEIDEFVEAISSMV